MIFKKKSDKNSKFKLSSSVVTNKDVECESGIKLPKFTAGEVKKIVVINKKCFYNILFVLFDDTNHIHFINEQMSEDDLMDFENYWKEHHTNFYFGNKKDLLCHFVSLYQEIIC